MKVLVTGGAGYIGSTTAAELLRRGHEVVVLDSLVRGHRAAVPTGAAFVHGDIADRSVLVPILAEARFDALVHFAAFAYVGESMSEPAMYLDNNVARSLVLFREALGHGVRRIVFSSSCTVYGLPARLPLDESHPKAALSPYGASKIMCEQALRWFADATPDLSAVALRYFNAAGATEERGEDHDPETHLIPLAIDAAMGHSEPLVIFGDDYDTKDGTCLRDYVHILDLAEAHALSVEAGDHEGFHAYNVGAGRAYSVREVLAEIEAVSGRPVPFKVGPRREGDAPALFAGTELIRDRLGWRAKFSSLARIVSDAVRWHPQSSTASVDRGE